MSRPLRRYEIVSLCNKQYYVHVHCRSTTTSGVITFLRFKKESAIGILGLSSVKISAQSVQYLPVITGVDEAREAQILELLHGAPLLPSRGEETAIIGGFR